MRLVVTALTSALFYVSVNSASIGPRPCTTPEGCSLEAPRCIKCPDAGENTPGYCSFLDPAWQTDLCLNMGYAQFCPNACANRHSISGGPTPATGIRGPIDSHGPTPVTVPETTPETNPGSNPGTSEQQRIPAEQTTPETSPGSNPGTSEQQRIPAEQTTPETSPGSNPGTSEQQRIPAEQGTPGSVQPQPEGSPQPGGSVTPGQGRHHQQTTPGSEPTPGSGQPTRPGQIVPAEDGSTMEVWPTDKIQETPPLPGQSTTPSTVPDQSPSSSGSQSRQPLQFPAVTGPSPDPNFYNNQPNAQTAPGKTLPLTPNNLSETGGSSIPDQPHTFTTPRLAFANVGDDYGSVLQESSAFPYTVDS